MDFLLTCRVSKKSLYCKTILPYDEINILMERYISEKTAKNLKAIYDKIEEVDIPSQFFITTWGVRIRPKYPTILHHFSSRFNDACSKYGFVFDEYDKQDQIPIQLSNKLSIEPVIKAFLSEECYIGGRKAEQVSQYEMVFYNASFAYHTDWPWVHRIDRISMILSTDRDVEEAQRVLEQSFCVSRSCNIQGSTIGGYHATCAMNAKTLHECDGVLAAQVKKVGNEVWDSYIATPIKPVDKKWLKSSKKKERIESWFEKEHGVDPTLAVTGAYAVISGTATARIRAITSSDNHELKRQKLVNEENDKNFVDGRKVHLGATTSANLLIYEANGEDLVNNVISVGRHLVKEPVTLKMLVPDKPNFSMAQFASGQNKEKLVAAVGHQTSPHIDMEAYHENMVMNSDLFKYTGIIASMTVVKEFDLFNEIGVKAAQSYNLGLRVVESIGGMPDQDLYLEDVSYSLSSIHE